MTGTGHGSKLSQRWGRSDPGDLDPHPVPAIIYGHKLSDLPTSTEISEATHQRTKRQSACLGGLTSSWGKEKSKRQGRKGKNTQLNAEFQGTARRDKKVVCNESCRETDENNTTTKIRDLFKKIEHIKGTFHCLQCISHPLQGWAA